MSLEGLRAWIGEVERKLGMRTRVFLVLAVIAVGLGGAAIYLAIDARESSVSESDVQALQERLEAQIGTGAGAAAGTQAAQLESELRALQAEVAELKGEPGGAGKRKGASEEAGGSSSGGSNAAAPGTGGGASSAENAGASAGGVSSKAKLQQLLEQAEQKNVEAETQKDGK